MQGTHRGFSLRPPVNSPYSGHFTRIPLLCYYLFTWPVQVQSSQVVVRYLLIFGRQSHIIAEGSPEIYVPACRERHLQAFEFMILGGLEGVARVTVPHVMRSRAQLGTPFVCIEAVSRHLLLVLFPYLSAAFSGGHELQQNGGYQLYRLAVLSRHDLGYVQRVHHRVPVLQISLDLSVGTAVHREDIRNDTVRHVDILLVVLDHRLRSNFP